MATFSNGTVRVENETRGAVLADRAQVARSWWSRGWGLLGRSKLTEGEGLVIDPCSSVHTWFMRFPIDLVYVDRSGTVLKTEMAVPPYRFSAVFRGHASVIELPAGIVERTKTQPGDRVRFQ